MSNDDILTDDYVAGLLAKDANDCALKYSAMGMEAFRPDKKPANLPKPNKRFLRHIIKDTDTHNKALLARETAESKARLEDLEQTEEVKRLKTNPNSRDIRRRQMGDIHAILGGKKRRREDDGPSSNPSSRDRGSRNERSAEKKPACYERDLFKDRPSDRKQHGRLERGLDDRSADDPRRDDRGRRRRERGSPASDDDRGRRHARRRRGRSRSTGRRRSHSPVKRRSKHRHRSPLHKDESTRKEERSEEEDSDPLDDLIGPAPPPRHRGRGTVGGAAGLDRRFSNSYDPKTDVQMDDEGDTGWDDAVEAFRDRQKLKKHQEERMRAAGFAAEDIEKAAASRMEKTGDDVSWSKAGEGREWDRGKGPGTDEALLSP